MVLLGPLVTFLSQPEQEDQLKNFQYNRNYPIYKLSQKIQISANKGKDDQTAKLNEILAKCGYIGIIYVWNAFPADDEEAYILRDNLSIKDKDDSQVQFVDIGLPVSTGTYPYQSSSAEGQFEVRPGEYYLTLIKRSQQVNKSIP